jgi:hypothetical protein
MIDSINLKLRNDLVKYGKLFKPPRAYKRGPLPNDMTNGEIKGYYLKSTNQGMTCR